MKEFYSGAVVPDCDVRFSVETSEEIMQEAAHHVPADHGVENLAPELIAHVSDDITTVPDP